MGQSSSSLNFDSRELKSRESKTNIEDRKPFRDIFPLPSSSSSHLLPPSSSSFLFFSNYYRIPIFAHSPFCPLGGLVSGPIHREGGLYVCPHPPHSLGPFFLFRDSLFPDKFGAKHDPGSRVFGWVGFQIRSLSGSSGQIPFLSSSPPPPFPLHNSLFSLLPFPLPMASSSPASGSGPAVPPPTFAQFGPNLDSVGTLGPPLLLDPSQHFLPSGADPFLGDPHFGFAPQQPSLFLHQQQPFLDPNCHPQLLDPCGSVLFGAGGPLFLEFGHSGDPLIPLPISSSSSSSSFLLPDHHHPPLTPNFLGPPPLLSSVSSSSASQPQLPSLALMSSSSASSSSTSSADPSLPFFAPPKDVLVTMGEAEKIKDMKKGAGNGQPKMARNHPRGTTARRRGGATGRQKARDNIGMANVDGQMQQIEKNENAINGTENGAPSEVAVVAAPPCSPPSCATLVLQDIQVAAPAGTPHPTAAECAAVPQQCAHCARDIRDPAMLAVRGALGVPPEFFHCECLKCSDCENPLENEPKCYVRAARTYCAACYGRNFGINCAMCERRIGPDVWVRRAREFVYHLACFKCEHCKRQLSTDEHFYLDSEHRPPPAIPRLLCKQHYLELVRGEQCSPKQKAKRVRTTFGEEQLVILQNYFKVDCNPDGADLERIANETGLSKRVTQVWFQNSRARQKKYHGHAGPCQKAEAGSGAGSIELCMSGGCRSATLSPSSSMLGAQSPLIFGMGSGSTGSESGDNGASRQMATMLRCASPQLNRHHDSNRARSTEASTNGMPRGDSVGMT